MRGISCLTTAARRRRLAAAGVTFWMNTGSRHGRRRPRGPRQCTAAKARRSRGTPGPPRRPPSPPPALVAPRPPTGSVARPGGHEPVAAEDQARGAAAWPAAPRAAVVSCSRCANWPEFRRTRACQPAPRRRGTAARRPCRAARRSAHHMPRSCTAAPPARDAGEHDALGRRRPRSVRRRGGGGRTCRCRQRQHHRPRMPAPPERAQRASPAGLAPAVASQRDCFRAGHLRMAR